jgi:hypothetical protein
MLLSEAAKSVSKESLEEAIAGLSRLKIQIDQALGQGPHNGIQKMLTEKYHRTYSELLQALPKDQLDKLIREHVNKAQGLINEENRIVHEVREQQKEILKIGIFKSVKFPDEFANREAIGKHGALYFPENNSIAVGHGRNRFSSGLKIYSFETGQSEMVASDAVDYVHGNNPNEMFYLSKKMELVKYDVKNRKVISKTKLSGAFITEKMKFEMSLDEQLVSIQVEGAITIYRVTTGEILHELEGGDRNLRFINDQEIMFDRDGDSLIKYNLATQKEKVFVTFRSDDIFDWNFTPDASAIYLYCKDSSWNKLIRVISAKNGKKIGADQILVKNRDMLTDLYVFPAGRSMIALAERYQNRIDVVDIRNVDNSEFDFGKNYTVSKTNEKYFSYIAHARGSKKAVIVYAEAEEGYADFWELPK